MSSRKIKMDCYVAKGINVSCRTINGEAFIFDHNTRLLLKLDEVGSFIWDQIDGEKTLKQISEICCQTFMGNKEEIQLSIQDFIDDLYSKNVVVLSAKPIQEEVAIVY